MKSWGWIVELVVRFRAFAAKCSAGFSAGWEELDRNPDLAMTHERNDLD